MEQTLNIISEFFGENTAFNIITFALAIIGVFSTWYFYKKSNKRRDPTFLVRTINLIEENVQKISPIRILFSEKEINNFSITKFALWNNGKETINQSDIAKNNPLRIQIDENLEILDCEIIYQKNSSNDFSISLTGDKKSIHINFDYFDHLEGIIIQIYHTGNNSSNFNLQGQVKSCKDISKKDLISSPLPKLFTFTLKKSNSMLMKKVTGWTLFVSGIAMLIYFIFLYFGDAEQIIDTLQKHDQTMSSITGCIASLLYIIIGYRALKRQIPKGFDIFNEEFRNNRTDSKV